MFRNLLEQHLYLIFEDSKDVNELFIRNNSMWLMEWLNDVKSSLDRNIKFKGIKNQFTRIYNYSLKEKRVDNMIAHHLQKVLYLLVFGGGDTKGFVDFYDRLPTANDRQKIAVFYYKDLFFYNELSKIDKRNNILTTDISILPTEEKENEQN